MISAAGLTPDKEGVGVLRFKKILVPVDGSKNSWQAVECGSYLAQCCNASLGILHVVNISSKAAAFTQSATGIYISDAIADSLQEEGRLVLEEAMRLVPPGITVKMFNEVGRPAEKIVAFCSANNYDLIVIGNRGLGAIQQLVIGSVSSYALHHASCPVMVIR